MPYSALKASILALASSGLAVLLGVQVISNLSAGVLDSALVYEQVSSIVIVAVLAAGCAAATWWALSAWVLLALMVPVASRERRERWTQAVKVFVPRAMRPLIVTSTGLGLVLGSLPAAAVEETPTVPAASQGFTLTMSSPVPSTTSTPAQDTPAPSSEPVQDTQDAVVSSEASTTDEKTVGPDNDTAEPRDKHTNSPVQESEPEPAQSEEHPQDLEPEPAFSLTFNGAPRSEHSTSKPSLSTQKPAQEPTQKPQVRGGSHEAPDVAINVPSPSTVSEQPESFGQTPLPRHVRNIDAPTISTTPATHTTAEVTGQEGNVANKSTPAQQATTQYTVTGGDSLWAIAAQQLPADASNKDIAERWQEIYELNREALGNNPDLIHPGTLLTLN